VAVTDISQNMVNRYAYTPEGTVNQSEAFAQPFKYVGQYGVMAESNGLYYMRARYYDPESGRFISEDPIGFEGGDVNLYVYSGNNPVMMVDPWGLRWFGGGDDGWSLGRPGTIIPPGGTVGAALETYGPAMETMSKIHDSLVGALVPELGDGKVATFLEKEVDMRVNIPTMPAAYAAAVVYETANSVVGAATGIYNFLTGGSCDKK
jgi:RHS repeat-associated protein